MANRMPEHHIKHIRLADVVTTTHERLAEKIYPINRNVVVIPNAIPTHEQFFPTKRIRASRDVRRIFWQGSSTHAEDIALLKGPMKRLDKNKFMAIMAGYTREQEWQNVNLQTRSGLNLNFDYSKGFTKTEQVWDRMVTMFTNGLRLPGLILQGTSVEKYYKNYRVADICVAPLVDNEFNSMKSNLKILEAAHMGLPVIASHVNPYLNMPGVMYAEKQSDWNRWFNAETAVLEAAANELKRFCDEHYNFDKINELRKNAII
jgi:glycosyltransferase involved in cell wall biosynthesis